jgi:hypothetical protein
MAIVLPLGAGLSALGACLLSTLGAGLSTLGAGLPTPPIRLAGFRLVGKGPVAIPFNFVKEKHCRPVPAETRRTMASIDARFKQHDRNHS